MKKYLIGILVTLTLALGVGATFLCLDGKGKAVEAQAAVSSSYGFYVNTELVTTDNLSGEGWSYNPLTQTLTLGEEGKSFTFNKQIVEESNFYLMHTIGSNNVRYGAIIQPETIASDYTDCKEVLRPTENSNRPTKLKIVVKGDVQLGDGAWAGERFNVRKVTSSTGSMSWDVTSQFGGIMWNGDIEISGGGNLQIRSHSYGINSRDNKITFTDVTVGIESYGNCMMVGEMVLTNADVTNTSYSIGGYGRDELTRNLINDSATVVSAGTITMKGSHLNAVGTYNRNNTTEPGNSMQDFTALSSRPIYLYDSTVEAKAFIGSGWTLYCKDASGNDLGNNLWVRAILSSLHLYDGSYATATAGENGDAGSYDDRKRVDFVGIYGSIYAYGNAGVCGNVYEGSHAASSAILGIKWDAEQDKFVVPNGKITNDHTEYEIDSYYLNTNDPYYQAKNRYLSQYSVNIKFWKQDTLYLRYGENDQPQASWRRDFSSIINLGSTTVNPADYLAYDGKPCSVAVMSGVFTVMLPKNPDVERYYIAQGGHLKLQMKDGANYGTVHVKSSEYYGITIEGNGTIEYLDCEESKYSFTRSISLITVPYICGGSLTVNGGGVYCEQSAMMTDGLITNCNASESGGGFYVIEFTMRGGTIKDCQASQGASVYCKNTFDADGGKVYDTVYVGIVDRTIENSPLTTAFYDKVTTAGYAYAGMYYAGTSGVIAGGVPVRFLNGTTAYATLIVRSGARAVAPSELCDLDWVNAETRKKYDFTDQVTKTISLRATWSDADNGHTWSTTEIIAKVDADCENSGTLEHWHCNTCGKDYAADKISLLEDITIAAHDHTYSLLIAQNNATCTETGLVAHYECSVCHKLFDEDKVEKSLEELTIAALGHTYGDLIVKVDESCTASGFAAHYECSQCHQLFDENKVEKTTSELVIVAHAHTYGDLIVKVDESCTASGFAAHYECSECHNLFDENKVIKTESELTIAKHAHTCGDLIAKVDESCTETGFAAYYVCSECHKFFDENKNEKTESELVIAAHAHSYGNLIVKVDESCTASGFAAHYECSECHNLFDENKAEKMESELTIAKHAHTYGDLIVKVDESCTASGFAAHYEYSECHNLFDENKVAKTEDELTIDKHEHTYGDLIVKVDESCTASGFAAHYECSECHNLFDENKVAKTEDELTIDKHAHTYGDLIVKVDESCTSTGFAAHYECSECHNLFDENKVAKTEDELTIDKHAHTYGDLIVKVDESCTATGFAAHYECSECHNLFDENKVEKTESELTIDKHAHTYGDLIVKVDESCTSTGFAAHYECSECHNLFDENKVAKTEDELTIAPHGHAWSTTEIIAEVVGDNCESTGTKAHWHCDACNKDYAEDKTTELTDLTIAATEHNFGDWICDKPATETEKGHLYRECSSCGAKEEKDINKLSGGCLNTSVSSFITIDVTLLLAAVLFAIKRKS